MKPNCGNEVQKEFLEVRGPGRQYWLVRVNGHVAQGARGSRDLVPLLVGGTSQAAEAVEVQL